MKNSNHILFSYKFGSKDKASELQNIDEISREIKAKNLAWVHFDAKNPATEEWLEKEISYLDPFIVEALLEDETRPRIITVGDGALIILRGVNLNKDSSPEDMVSVRLWIDPHRIISLQRREVRAILDIEDMLKEGASLHSSGDFLCSLITKLFERIESVLTILDEDTDGIEEQILDNPEPSFREDIINIRKQAIMLRRYMLPQKEVISTLKNSDIVWLNNGHKRHLQESYDRITRYVEDLDAIRERAQIVKDELVNVLSDKLNKNMYMLSVIAAIFLPLGFLTGLLGINVGGIPGADNHNAFYIFCGMIVAIIIAQIILFKKFKWF